MSGERRTSRVTSCVVRRAPSADLCLGQPLQNVLFVRKIYAKYYVQDKELSRIFKFGRFVTVSLSLESIILFVNPIIINVQIIFKLTKNSKYIIH